MPFITTKDGTEIFYKDWGTGQPIVFHHGWPLSADDWDAQMLFFLARATASSPTTAAAMAARPRPTPATTWTPMPPTSPRWSTRARPQERHPRRPFDRRRRGGRAMSRDAEPGRVAKAVLIGAVPPIMLKTDCESRAACRSRCSTASARRSAANRAQFYLDIPTRPFLRLQPSGRESLAGRHPQLVAAGHDGRRQGRTTIASRPSRKPTSPRI